MEVKINKEIRNYTEDIFFGLSFRQFFFSVLSCIVAIAIYFAFKSIVGKEVTSWLCMICAFPFIMLGFFKYNGLPTERIIKFIIKNHVLTPKKLLFKPVNFYKLLIGGIK